MSKIKNLTGQRFGRLLVISFVRLDDQKKAVWLCKCDCGIEKEIASRTLGRNTFSCGCYHRDITINTHRTHGATRTLEYKSWKAMHGRCYTTSNVAYSHYGGRGINVCERWMDFQNFLADMGLKPTPQHTIDRINNDGNYEPGNCRWATRSEQARNTRRSHIIDVAGRRMIITDLAKMHGIAPATITYRMEKCGMSTLEAIMTPSQGIDRKDVPEIRRLISAGVKQSAIAKMFSVHPSTISLIKSGKQWRND